LLCILKGADLDNLSTKKIRKQLEKEFDTDLTKRKKEIDGLVMEMITKNEENETDEEDSNVSTKDDRTHEDSEEVVKKENESAESSSEEIEEVPKKKAKRSAPAAPKSSGKRKSASKADDSEDPIMSGIVEMNDEDLAKKLQEEESGLRRRGGRRPPPPPKQKKERDPEKKKNSTYSRPCVLSEALAAVLGTNEMARHDIVKNMWAIVKERNLQDPDKKQYMVCDEQLEALFGCKRLKTFSMMKYLKRHIKDPLLI